MSLIPLTYDYTSTSFNYSAATVRAFHQSSAMNFFWTDPSGAQEAVIFRRTLGRAMNLGLFDVSGLPISASGVVLELSGGVVSAATSYYDVVSTFHAQSFQISSLSAGFGSLSTAKHGTVQFSATNAGIHVLSTNLAAVSVATIGDLSAAAVRIAALSATTAGIGILSTNTLGTGVLSATTAGIGALSVTTAGIDALSVTTAGIGALSVTTAGISALSVTTAGIGALSVTTAGISALSTTTAGIGALSVTTAGISSLSTTTAGIGALSVTTAGIGLLSANTIGTGVLSATTVGIQTLVATIGRISALSAINISFATGAISSLSTTTAGIGTLSVTTAGIGTLSTTNLAVVNGDIGSVFIGNAQVNNFGASLANVETFNGQTISVGALSAGTAGINILSTNLLGASTFATALARILTLSTTTISAATVTTSILNAIGVSVGSISAHTISANTISSVYGNMSIATANNFVLAGTTSSLIGVYDFMAVAGSADRIVNESAVQQISTFASSSVVNVRLYASNAYVGWSTPFMSMSLDPAGYPHLVIARPDDNAFMSAHNPVFLSTAGEQNALILRGGARVFGQLIADEASILSTTTTSSITCSGDINGNIAFFNSTTSGYLTGLDAEFTGLIQSPSIIATAYLGATSQLEAQQRATISSLTVSGESAFMRAVSVNASVAILGDLHVIGDAYANAHITTSDQRLKKEVETVSGALSTVCAMRGVRYRWSDDRSSINPGYKEYGVIAQEVESVSPGLVKTGPGPDAIKAVAYDRIVPLLIEAIKELTEIVLQNKPE